MFKYLTATRWISLLAILGLLTASAGLAEASHVVDLHDFTGSDLVARATFEQVGDDILVTLTTVQEPGHPNTGDWGGFWFDISDDSLLANLSVVGSDITAYDFSGNVGSVGSANNNLNGGGSPGNMDAGIAFGSPGASSGLLETTEFTLTHPSGLTLSLFDNQTVAARLQSVGAAPCGGGNSSKLIGTVTMPEPASLMLMGLGGAYVLGRRRV